MCTFHKYSYNKFCLLTDYCGCDLYFNIYFPYGEWVQNEDIYHAISYPSSPANLTVRLAKFMQF